MVPTKLVLCLIALFSIVSPGVSEWKDSTSNSADVVAGDNALLESGLHNNLQFERGNPDALTSKSVDNWLTGTDLFSAKLASSDDLTITDGNGVVHKYATTTKKSW